MCYDIQYIIKKWCTKWGLNFCWTLPHVCLNVIIQSHEYPQALCAVIKFSWWFGGCNPQSICNISQCWQSINDSFQVSLYSITKQFGNKVSPAEMDDTASFSLAFRKCHRKWHARVIDCCLCYQIIISHHSSFYVASVTPVWMQEGQNASRVNEIVNIKANVWMCVWHLTASFIKRCVPCFDFCWPASNE